MRSARFSLALGAAVLVSGGVGERSASAQCDSANASCQIGNRDVYIDPNDPYPTATVPRGYYDFSKAAELGFAESQSTQNATSMSSAACGGFALGGAIAAVSALDENKSDLFEHARCDGSPVMAALLHGSSGSAGVPAPAGQGVAHAIRPDGTSVTGDGGTTDPVDPVTGEFILENEDFALPSWGVPFRLRRVYRSRLDYVGPFGPGWDHTYNQRLLNAPGSTIDTGPLPTASGEIGDATLTMSVGKLDWSSCGPRLLLTTGEGTSILFNEISDTAGTHSYWSSATLLTLIGTEGPGGLTWTLHAPDGTVRSFDVAGRLVRWVDANEIGLNLEWTGGATDARLSSITDSVGRLITFEYDASNRLVRVALDGSALEASYEYDGNGALLAAHRADGRSESYEYDVDLSRLDADWIPEQELQAGCAAACARTDSATCSTGGACDEPVATALADCFQWADNECPQQCHSECIDLCTGGPGPNYDTLPCDAACEHAPQQYTAELAECVRVWNEEGAKATCEACDDECDSGAQSICDDLAVSGSYSGSVSECQNSLASCCADGSLCAPGSCNAGDSCENICEQAFFGYEEIDTDCRRFGWWDDNDDPVLVDQPHPPDRWGCMRNATDACKSTCGVDCASAQCEPQCKAECTHSSCMELDFEATCQDTCTSSCIAAGRAPDPSGGPRYGRPRDLNFNIKRVKDAAGRVYLENTYGTDIWSPDFDSVTLQHFGEYSPQLARWDLNSGVGGPAPPRLPAWAQPLIETAAEFTPVDICPYTCPEQPVNLPWDELVVPFSTDLHLVFLPGPVSSPAAGFAVNRTLTQQVGPTLVKFTTNAQGALVGTISRRTSTTNYFATTAVSLPITLNNGEAVTLATSRTGAVTITGTAAGKAQLSSMGTMTLFTDAAKHVQAYPGAPTEFLKTTSGSCTAPFTFQRISSSEIKLSPPTACSGELWVTPVGGAYPSQSVADQFPANGLSALSTSAFHPSTLAPTRGGAVWRAGIDGRRTREAPPTGAGINDARAAATAQYAATPMFSAPTSSSGLGEPLYVFHHVAADYKISNPPPPPSDDPWSSSDLPLQDFTFTCDPQIPSLAIHGGGSRPTQATALIDFHGARWTVYADDNNNVLRRVNHETGAVWSFNYDPVGQLTGIEYPDLARTCMVRDLRGNVTRTVEMPAQVPGLPTPDPIVQGVSYHPANSAVTQIDDPRNPSTWLAKVTRDAAGNPLSVQEAGGITTAAIAVVGGVDGDRFQIASVTAPGDAITTVSYDAGAVASVTVDPAGANQHQDLDRDPEGRLRARTGALGLYETWSYDGDGPRLASMAWTGDGHTARRAFEYDTDGQVTAIKVGVENAERLRTELTYDVTGALVRTKQIALDGTAATAVTCQDIAPGGRVNETVSAEGIRTRYTRDGEGHVTQIVAGDLGPSTRAWDDGCLDHPTGGTGTFTMGTFSYDLDGRMVSSTDERGRLTTIAYDGLGRAVMVTRPDGTQDRRGYDALGNVIWDATYSTSNLPGYRPPSWSDGGLHAATQYFFDGRNRLYEIWRWHFDGAQVPVGDGYSITHLDYDDVAHTVTRRDDGGFQWVSRFDAAGRIVEERAPDGTSRTYSYPDARTVRISEPGPSGTITREMSLTAWGDVVSEGPRVGSTTYTTATTQFDELLRPITSISHTGETSNVTFDAFGRTTRVVHAVPGGANETVTVGYDRDGRPLTRTSVADGATTGTWTWQYDVLGREKDALDPGGRHTTTTYLLGSQLPNVVTDPRGVQFQHSWSTNSNTLFLNAVDPSGPDVSLTYAWDERGNLVSASRTDEGSTAVANTFQYDSLDDRTKETDNQLPTAWTRTAQFDGRGLATKTWLNTSTISRTFDTLGRPATVKWGSESTPLATYSYSGFDFRLTRALQNNLTTFYGYDSLGRLTSQTDGKVTTTPPTTIASFAWQVPLDGVPRRQDFHRGTPGENSVFTVDAALRTIDEDNTSLGTFTLAPTTTWASANAAAAPTLTAKNWNYTLDGRSAWSRRVRGTSGTTDYLRDARDALTRIGTQNTTLDARGAIISDGSVQALYDALGQVKQLQTGTKVRIYKRDALGRIVSETNESAQTTRFAWDGSTRIVRQRADGTTFDVTVDGAGLDEHIATITGSQRQFLHQDRRGSVYMVSNTSGVATEWTSYTAYGEPTLRDPAGTPLTNTAVNGQFGFNGLPQDFVLGVVDMRARTYRPVLGRFLSPDPLGLIDGTNRFAFAGARPLSFLDPFGLNSRDNIAFAQWAGNHFFDNIPSGFDYSTFGSATDPDFILGQLREVNDLNDPCNPTVGQGCWMDPAIQGGRDVASSALTFVANVVDSEARGAFVSNPVVQQLPSPNYAAAIFATVGGDPTSAASKWTSRVLIGGSLFAGGVGIWRGAGAWIARLGPNFDGALEEAIASYAAEVERASAPNLAARALERPAQNAATAPLLRDQLITEEAGSIFTASGELTPDAIARSRVAIAGGDLKNPALISELTSDGSLITDWAKMSTPTVRSLAGDFQMHFYLNLKTGVTYYGADYKVVFNSQVVGQ
jgi:RHS repeat-associated protein